MFWIELLTLSTIFATAAVFYRCGKKDGYGEGYIAGNNAAVDKMKPTGAVRVIPPQR